MVFREDAPIRCNPLHFIDHRFAPADAPCRGLTLRHVCDPVIAPFGAIPFTQDDVHVLPCCCFADNHSQTRQDYERLGRPRHNFVRERKSANCESSGVTKTQCYCASPARLSHVSSCGITVCVHEANTLHGWNPNRCSTGWSTKRRFAAFFICTFVVVTQLLLWDLYITNTHAHTHAHTNTKTRICSCFICFFCVWVFVCLIDCLFVGLLLLFFFVLFRLVLLCFVLFWFVLVCFALLFVSCFFFLLLLCFVLFCFVCFVQFILRDS